MERAWGGVGAARAASAVRTRIDLRVRGVGEANARGEGGAASVAKAGGREFI